MPELGVAVGMRAARQDAGVSAQAESGLLQQCRDRVPSDVVSPGGQLPREVAQRLRGPGQRPYRVALRAVVDQVQQRGTQSGVLVGRGRAAPAGAAHPAHRFATLLEIGHAPADTALRYSGGRGDGGDSAVSELPGLRAVQQAALALIQVRNHRFELRPQRTDQLIETPHTMSTSPSPGSNT